MLDVFGGVSQYGNFNRFLVIIAVNGQSTVVLPFKFHGYFVIFFKRNQEMIIIVIGKVFDAKIVNAKE